MVEMCDWGCQARDIRMKLRVVSAGLKRYPEGFISASLME